MCSFPGWHSQPIWDEAAQKQHLWGVLPADHVPEEAGCSEGTAVDRVWVRERTGLWRRSQGVVLPLIQGDVQSVLWPVWILCHVSFCLIFKLRLKKQPLRSWTGLTEDTVSRKAHIIRKLFYMFAVMDKGGLKTSICCIVSLRDIKFPFTLINLSSHSKSHPGTNVSHMQYTSR